jgi:TerC family integral membrane protein
MADHPLAVNGAPLSLWVSFALPVLVLLALDLGLFLRSGRDPSIKESVAWIAIWASLAGVFGIALTSKLGTAEGLAFLTGYVVEQALSVDNLFVFLLVFGQLAVPKAAQKRALAYGVLGALVLRIGMLAAGGAFIARFHALGWALGALLVVMGIKAAHKLRAGADDKDEGDAPRTSTSLITRSRRTSSVAAKERHGPRRSWSSPTESPTMPAPSFVRSSQPHAA